MKDYLDSEELNSRTQNFYEFNIAEVTRSMDDGDEVIFLAFKTNKLTEALRDAYHFEQEIYKDHDGRPAFNRHVRDLYAYE